MTERHENHAEIELSPEDVFKPTRGDAIHSGVKAALGTLPVFGGVAAEVFAAFIAAPSAKRLENFLNYVGESLKQLEAKVEGFNIDALSENETFQTTMIQASQAAMRTHSKEKHRALRNAVLKSALPNPPDEDRQAMFIQLRDELTDLHMRILALFERETMPSLHLDDPEWRMNIAVDEFGDVVERVYPDLKGEYHLYVQSLDDLHRRGLITNLLSSRAMLTQISHAPALTPYAKEFLAFIKSPLDDD